MCQESLTALPMLRNCHPLHRWVAQWHFKDKETMKLCNHHRHLKKINCKARIGSQSFWLQDLPYTMYCLCEETPPLRHPHLLVYGVQFSGTLPHGSKNTPPNSSDLLCQVLCCRTGDTNSNPLSMPPQIPYLISHTAHTARSLPCLTPTFIFYTSFTLLVILFYCPKSIWLFSHFTDTRCSSKNSKHVNISSWFLSIAEQRWWTNKWRNKTAPSLCSF